MIAIAAGLIVVFLAFFLVARRSRAAGMLAEASYRVVLDADHISCAYPSGEVQSIAWTDLALVQIITNDAGPWGVDVLWGFHDRSGIARVVIPGGAAGEPAMLRSLRQLPGFDPKAVIDAMGSTSTRRFIVWSGAVGRAPGAN